MSLIGAAARSNSSQKRRLLLAEVAASSDMYSSWAIQPFVVASKRYIRSAGSAGPTNAKSQARFPYVAPVPPDRKA